MNNKKSTKANGEKLYPQTVILLCAFLVGLGLFFVYMSAGGLTLFVNRAEIFQAGVPLIRKIYAGALMGFFFAHGLGMIFALFYVASVIYCWHSGKVEELWGPDGKTTRTWVFLLISVFAVAGWVATWFIAEWVNPGTISGNE